MSTASRFVLIRAASVRSALGFSSPVRHFFSAVTIMSATLPVLLVGCQPGGGAAVVGTEEAVLTHAPAVPPPISSHPTRLIVNLETQWGNSGLVVLPSAVGPVRR